MGTLYIPTSCCGVGTSYYTANNKQISTRSPAALWTTEYHSPVQQEKNKERCEAEERRKSIVVVAEKKKRNGESRNIPRFDSGWWCRDSELLKKESLAEVSLYHCLPQTQRLLLYVCILFLTVVKKNHQLL